MTHQLGLHLLTHRLKVGIVGEVEARQDAAQFDGVVEQAVIEPTFRVTQPLGHQLNMTVKPLPSLFHSQPAALLDPTLDVSVDGGQFVVGQLDTEVIGRDGHDDEVHAELVPQIVDIGVVGRIVEVAEEPLGVGLQVGVVTEELAHHSLPLRLPLAEGGHEVEVVGGRQHVGILQPPRQGVGVELPPDVAGHGVDVGEAVAHGQQLLVVVTGVTAGVVGIGHLTGGLLVQLAGRPLRDVELHQQSAVGEMRGHGHVSLCCGVAPCHPVVLNLLRTAPTGA